MGKKKITPKKGRRELPDALKRWNTARSDISKRNRQLGRNGGMLHYERLRCSLAAQKRELGSVS